MVRPPCLGILISAVSLGSLLANEIPPPPGRSTGAPLRLFLDCQQGDVDLDFIRREIPWVDWVRDREGAQVHALVTYQGTGGGGGQYKMRFIGQESFRGQNDELVYIAQSRAVPDEVRRGLASQLAIGLAHYAVRLPTPTPLMVRFDGDKPTASDLPGGRDPWNQWVFRASSSGSFSGESQTSSSSLLLSLNASRITEESLFRAFASGLRSRNTYDLGDGTTYESKQDNVLFSVVDAEALSPHWTWGLMMNRNHSTYDNIASSYRAGPGLEYNLWKYSEVSQRQLTFLYQMGVNHNQYMQRTILGRTQEWAYDQSLTIAMDLNQPWGTVSTSFGAASYLPDLAKNSLSFRTYLDVRLAKGLSLNLYASVSSVKNQIALTQDGATSDDVLTHNRALPTSFRYSGRVGFTYTFGSIFNNAINSRFRNAGVRDLSDNW